MTLAGSVWQARALVEVMPKSPRDVKLKIVWRGPMKQYLERRASELGVSERVDFYNNLPKKELLHMCANADVFAVLSRYAAYSIVVARANLESNCEHLSESIFLDGVVP
jgi:glycosyltransferase involved in cell wall biosynthesis